jgi:hypothetical protein
LIIISSFSTIRTSTGHANPVKKALDTLGPIGALDLIDGARFLKRADARFHICESFLPTVIGARSEPNGHGVQYAGLFHSASTHRRNTEANG